MLLCPPKEQELNCQLLMNREVAFIHLQDGICNYLILRRSQVAQSSISLLQSQYEKSGCCPIKVRTYICTATAILYAHI